MPKINQEEYEVLKGLDDKWKWIARDKDNTLVMGAGKNERYLDGWFPPVNVGDSLVVDETNAVKDVSEWGNLFQFIQWEDESPYNIQELIEEYLYDNRPKLFIDGQEQSFEFIEESEEKEVKKDIEWLSQWIEEYENEVIKVIEKRKDEKDEVDGFITTLSRGKQSAIKRIKQKINQLDEPEVLSEDWIEEHHYIRMDPDNPFVYVKDLQNLLVPKQELPVIPKFVADWIESRKNNYPSDVIGVYLRMNELSANEQTREVLRWVHES